VAVLNRCRVCDYTQTAGSSFGDSSPGTNGQVRRYRGELLCDLCKAEIQATIADYPPEPEPDQGVKDE
jgi:hypothetical protein